jgi:hypothetical protein
MLGLTLGTIITMVILATIYFLLFEIRDPGDVRDSLAV